MGSSNGFLGGVLLLGGCLPHLLCRREWADTPLPPRAVVGCSLKMGHDAAWQGPFLDRLDVEVQYSWLFQQLEGPLAQLVEHRTFNPWVVGSIPTGPTLSAGRRR